MEKSRRPLLIRLEDRYSSLDFHGVGPVRLALIVGCYAVGVRNGLHGSGQAMLVWLAVASICALVVWGWDR